MASITDKLRSRFRPEKHTSSTVEDKEDDKKSNQSDDGGDSRETSEEVDEKKVYEMQLSQLQEQLVAAVIENQALDAEVKSLRDGTGVTEIRQELESEKTKTKALQEHLEYAQKSQIRGIYTRDISDWVDVAHEATEEVPAHIRGDAPQPSLIDRFNNWLVSVYFEVLADLTEDVEPTEIENIEGDQLTVKKLKDNIKRFKKNVKPIGGTAKEVHRVMTWKNPALTFIIFMVYMYSVWYGWLLPVVLFMMILKLSINYLRHRGLNINLVLLADEEDEDKDSDTFKELGMSAKFDLVVHVARKVQNTLGQLADNLEKLKNLLMWEQPVVTRRIYVMLCTMFILTCVLPGTTLFTILALLFGVRMFIIQYIYTKFPRIKQRHDGTQRMWRSLPTDAEKEELYQKAAIDRSLLPAGEGRLTRGQSSTQKRAVSERDAEFAELFQLPTSEHPLKGWKAGKRCTLIDKEKSLRSTFKTGKMYLTHSFLCFERHKSLTHAQMSIILPLTDILKIDKAKPYSWLPGEGMSIEITVVGQDKPYTFGAILNRDEVFENIVSHGAKVHLPWASEHIQNTITAENESDGNERTSLDQPPAPSSTSETTAEKEQFSADSQNLFL